MSDTLVHRCHADGEGGWSCDCPGAEERVAQARAGGDPRVGSVGRSRCDTPESPTLVDGRPLTCTQAMLLYCSD